MPKDRATMPPVLEELLATTSFDRYVIGRHGYRRFRVVGSDVTADPYEYDPDDRIHQLQQRLAQAAGSRVDNHECYEILSGDRTICLWFYDWKLVVGTDIQPY